MTNTTFVLGIVLAAIISIGSLVTLGPMAERAENDIMAQEIITVTSAVASMGRQQGTYAGITAFKDLVDNGYLDSQYYTDGVGENYRKGDITARVAGQDYRAVVTYQTFDLNSCYYIGGQRDNFPGENGTTCAVDPGSNNNGLITIYLR